MVVDDYDMDGDTTPGKRSVTTHWIKDSRLESQGTVGQNLTQEIHVSDSVRYPTPHKITPLKVLFLISSFLSICPNPFLHYFLQ